MNDELTGAKKSSLLLRRKAKIIIQSIAPKLNKVGLDAM
jgi:hypothetical protein